MKHCRLHSMNWVLKSLSQVPDLHMFFIINHSEIKKKGDVGVDFRKMRKNNVG